MAQSTISVTNRGNIIGFGLLALVVVALLCGPLYMGRGDMRLVIEISSYLTLATMWNLLAGYAGLVSVGQQAFVGIGGYSLFAAVVFLGINPIYGVLLAGLFSGLIAIPTAFIAFRLKGAYFAIGTWVIAEVYMLSVGQISALGGGSGMSLPIKAVKGMIDGRAAREALIYLSAVGLALTSIGVVYAFLRSRQGLALTAIRDSETAAASIGIDNRRLKLIIYCLVALVTGLAGALIFLSKLRISPESAFSVVDWTAYVLFITVIGGIGRIEGPIIGTLVFFLLRGLLADLGSIYLVILGLTSVVIMLKAPGGLWGLILERFDFEIFPVRRRLNLPPSS